VLIANRFSNGSVVAGEKANARRRAVRVMRQGKSLTAPRRKNESDILS
jgi:hypothetical protein